MSFIGNTFFLISAIVLNTAVFTDLNAWGLISLTKEEIDRIINISSFIILLISIVVLVIEWGKKASGHEQAVNQLSRLLTEIRRVSLLSDDELKKEQSEMLNQLYDQTFEPLPKIEDSKFNKLKARHYYKKELSKFIDANKGKPFFVIRTQFFFKKLFSKSN